MSRRSNAPYRDRIEENGNALIYEGHDISRSPAGPNPKLVDQPRVTPYGKLTQNGMFAEAAAKAKVGSSQPELVAVYEKIHAGIWAFNGCFLLTDSWTESDGQRNVFKFRLELSVDANKARVQPSEELLAQPFNSVGGQARSLDERQRPVRPMRQQEEFPFRSRSAVFQGRFVLERQQYQAALRKAQFVKRREDPVK